MNLIMKKARDFISMGKLSYKSRLLQFKTIEEWIKQAQLDAIEETVKLCAKNAKLLEQSNWGNYEDAHNDSNPNLEEKEVIKKNNYGHGDCTYQIIRVSKQSILNCADILKKELE